MEIKIFLSIHCNVVGMVDNSKIANLTSYIQGMYSTIFLLTIFLNIALYQQVCLLDEILIFSANKQCTTNIYNIEPWRAKGIFPNYFSGITVKNHSPSEWLWHCTSSMSKMVFHILVLVKMQFQKIMTYYSAHDWGNKKPCLTQSSVHYLSLGNKKRKRLFSIQLSFT